MAGFDFDEMRRFHLLINSPELQKTMYTFLKSFSADWRDLPRRTMDLGMNVALEFHHQHTSLPSIDDYLSAVRPLVPSAEVNLDFHVYDDKYHLKVRFSRDEEWWHLLDESLYRIHFHLLEHYRMELAKRDIEPAFPHIVLLNSANEKGFRLGVKPINVLLDTPVDFWRSSGLYRLPPTKSRFEATLERVGGDAQFLIRDCSVEFSNSFEGPRVELTVLLPEPGLVSVVDEHLAADFVKCLDLSLRAVRVPTLSLAQGLEAESLGYEFCPIERGVEIIFDILIKSPVALTTLGSDSRSASEESQTPRHGALPALPISEVKISRTHGLEQVQWDSKSGPRYTLGRFSDLRIPITSRVQHLCRTTGNNAL